MNAPLPLRPDAAAYAREQRRSITRGITALALAQRGENPADIVRRSWPNDAGAGLFLKSAVSPTSTSSYPTYSAVKTLAGLAPRSAASRLFSVAQQVDLGGIAQVSIPYAATWPSVGFVAEGAPGPAAQFTTAAITVGPTKKLMVMAGFTGELISATATTAETIVGNVLATATGKALDSAVFSTTAADSTRPGGILAGLTPIVATAGGGLNALVSDLGNLAGDLADGGIDADDMVVIAHPETCTKIRMLASAAFTNTVLGSAQVSAGTVIAVAPSGFVVGYNGAVEIESSSETTIHFEDTLPAQIGTPGTPNVIAAPTRSAFQQDLVVLRVKCRCAWAALPHAVAYLTGATW